MTAKDRGGPGNGGPAVSATTRPTIPPRCCCPGYATFELLAELLDQLDRMADDLTDIRRAMRRAGGMQ